MVEDLKPNAIWAKLLSLSSALIQLMYHRSPAINSWPFRPAVCAVGSCRSGCLRVGILQFAASISHGLVSYWICSRIFQDNEAKTRWDPMSSPSSDLSFRRESPASRGSSLGPSKPSRRQYARSRQPIKCGGRPWSPGWSKERHRNVGCGAI